MRVAPRRRRGRSGCSARRTSQQLDASLRCNSVAASMARGRVDVHAYMLIWRAPPRPAPGELLLLIRNSYRKIADLVGSEAPCGRG